ncbi:MAG: O-antigen ligase family protein [Candidatus Aminicenantia bacterium]
MIGLGSAEKKFKLKIFYYSMTVLSLILMVFTKSFGGILGFLAGFFLLMFLIGKRDLRILLIILTISVSIFSTIVYLRIETLETKNPLTLRLLNWNLAMRVISQHPFFGVGLGNYPSFSLQLAKKRTEATKYAHSFFLQLTAETGILCALLLFIVIFEWFRKRVKLISIDYCEAGVWSAILSLLIYNLIDIGIYFESFGILTVILISYLSNRNDYFEIRRLGKIIFSSALTIMIIFSCWVYITEDLIQKVSFEMGGDLSLAERHLIFTRKINPFNPKIYSYHSFIESKKDHLGSALEYIEKSISLYPYSHSLYYERGVIYLKLGEPIKAYLSIREAEKFNPTFSPYMEERKKLEDFLFRRRK